MFNFKINAGFIVTIQKWVDKIVLWFIIGYEVIDTHHLFRSSEIKETISINNYKY